MPLMEGQAFAGYTILRRLGSGGMGEIYLAQHPRLPRTDAIKVLPSQVSSDDEYQERFNREADIAATLWHPHIVTVHDRGESDGQLWISMDFVDGTDAARLLAERYPHGMPPDEVVRIVTAVAAALDYAHQRNLLHRDVKPANILLAQPDSGDERVMLADFGIARWADDASGLTATNMTVGTVAYAAPEQLMGENIDGRADQYALAATAFHLLTGTPPFQHSNAAVVISQHLNTTPPAIGSRRPELSGLGPVFSKALAKAPQDRFETCMDFARTLDQQLNAVARDLGATDQTISAPVAAARRHHKKRDVKIRPAVLTAAVLGVLLVGVSIVALLLFGRDENQTATPSSAPVPSVLQDTPQPPAAPVIPVVAIGADCDTLGAVGVTESGASAYCSRLQSSGASLWSLYPGDITSPTVTTAPTDEVLKPEVASPVRVCMEQTGQTFLQCREDIRRANANGSRPR